MTIPKEPAMFNAKTLIAVLFSLLMGLVAVKAYSVFTHSRPAKEKVQETNQNPAEPERPLEKTEPEIYSRAIPRGKRIVSLKVDEVSGVTRGLARDDLVDLIAVTELTGTGGGKIARTVLQSVRVFDVEEAFYQKQLTDPALKKKKSWTVQLLVRLDQAVVLASVDEAATLRLVMRNPEDEAVEVSNAVIFTPEAGLSREGETGPALASHILPGMRAIDLAVDDSSGICSRLRPGDRVDVIMSSRISRFTTQEGNEAVGTQAVVNNLRKSSKILLQNIQVIATDQPLNPLTGKVGSVSMVSLMVTPRQAEKLAVVSDTAKSGVIRLLLRGTDDHEQVTTRGELFSDQVLTDKRAFRVIDTIKGTKTYPRKYYDE